MDNVKTFIKDNKVLIIIGVVLSVACASLYYFDYLKNKQIYDKNQTSDTPYVKHEYEANQYTNIDIELIDVLNDYYSYYIKKKYTAPKEAYEMLSSESKSKFETIEKYEDYCKKSKTIFSFTNEIKEYRNNADIKNAYDIIDTEGNKYTFIEKAVWDIEVIDNGK